MAERKKKVVMFPLMAQGHIIPFLSLAYQLERTNNCIITFVSTPLNIQKIQSSLSPTSTIQFLAIPFSNLGHGLPPNVENTDALPNRLIPTFVEACFSLKTHFRKLISDLLFEQDGHSSLCIIADMFFGWCAEVGREFGVFTAIFCGSGGFGFACYYSLWAYLPHRQSDSDEITLPDFPEASTIHITQMSNNLRLADGSDKSSQLHKKLLSLWVNFDGILFNTIEELDNIGLMYFRRKIGRPVWAVGPVLMGNHQVRARKDGGIILDMCMNWLNTKPAKSVLYVCFGSQNTISKIQMMELALALEASSKNFIWVVRLPIGFDITCEFKPEEWLPDGFKQRIEDQGNGLLVHQWAPQVDILSHEAVCAFLSHCGWNSVLEALSCAKPIIGWPLSAEQFYNAKLLDEEIGVCVEVARGLSCEVRHEAIMATIELVMNETEKGCEMRRKARQVKDMIVNANKDKDGFKGSSIRAMEEFLDSALLMKGKTKKPSSVLHNSSQGVQVSVLAPQVKIHLRNFH